MTALFVGLGSAAVLRFGTPQTAHLAVPTGPLTAPWLVSIPIWVGAFAVFGLYNPNRWANSVDEARRVVAAGLAAPTAVVLLTFALHTLASRLWLGVGTALSIALVGVGRRGLRWTVSALRRRGDWR